MVSVYKVDVLLIANEFATELYVPIVKPFAPDAETQLTPSVEYCQLL